MTTTMNAAMTESPSLVSAKSHGKKSPNVKKMRLLPQLLSFVGWWLARLFSVRQRVRLGTGDLSLTNALLCLHVFDLGCVIELQELLAETKSQLSTNLLAPMVTMHKEYSHCPSLG